jgi:putative ATP-binding cassette transporter
MTRGHVKGFVRDLGSLIRPYWTSREGLISGVLLGCVVVLTVGKVYVNVLMNQWYALFFNALQDRSRAGFTHQLFRFSYLVAIWVSVGVYQTYLRRLVEMRWRRWLTERFTGRWLAGNIPYLLQLGNGATDNPDQRIAEDVGGFTASTLDLSFGLMESFMNLVAFVGILWGLSGTLEIGGLSIPGYMVWAALLFSIAGTWATHRVGRILIPLNFRQQKLEANFRFSLVRVRENAEAISLYGGEVEESRRLRLRLDRLIGNWLAVIRRQRTLEWFTSAYYQASVVFSYVIMAPRYFSGALKVGEMIQSQSAFSALQRILSWFVFAYASLASWKATVDRLIGFEEVLTETEAAPPPKLVRQDAPADHGIAVKGLDIWLPNGTSLASEIDAQFPKRSWTVLTGPSGCGKSTLFKAISGLWPCCAGSVSVPAGARLLFIPQKSYLPIVPFRSALTYPDMTGSYPTTDICQALDDCGLTHLAGRLEEEAHWVQELSPGEQQRLSFARILLIRPDYLFLDEVTSSLDEATEATLYGLLIERMPDVTVVSITHRPSLTPLHNRSGVFVLSPRGGYTVVFR